MKKIKTILLTSALMIGSAQAQLMEGVSVTTDPSWYLYSGFSGGIEVDVTWDSSVEISGSFGKGTFDVEDGIVGSGIESNLYLSSRRGNVRYNWYEDGVKEDSFYLSGATGLRVIRVGGANRVGDESTVSSPYIGAYIGKRYKTDLGVSMRLGVGAIYGQDKNIKYKDKDGFELVRNINGMPLINNGFETDINLSYDF